MTRPAIRVALLALVVAACADRSPGAQTADALAAAGPDDPVERAAVPVRGTKWKSERARLRALARAQRGTESMLGPEPGRVHATSAFDLTTLPVMPAPTPAGANDRVAGAFAIKPGEGGGPTLEALADLVAEVEIGESRLYHPEGVPPNPLNRASTTPGVMRTSPCFPGGRGVRPATLEGFRSAGWFRDGLSYVRMEGELDVRLCQGQVARVGRVRAPAIIPGLLYAFRERVDRLVLVGPAAEWAASSAPVGRPYEPRIGSFTRLTLPVTGGTTASALMNVNPLSVARAARLRGETVDWIDDPALRHLPVVTLSVEIVWPRDEQIPRARAFAIALEPGGSELLEAVGIPPNE